MVCCSSFFTSQCRSRSICVVLLASICLFFFFFFNDTATTEIYTLSLHDALPISRWPSSSWGSTSSPTRAYANRSKNQAMSATVAASPRKARAAQPVPAARLSRAGDRKSTRLNSSHTVISYAVFCLKKKKNRKDALWGTPRTPATGPRARAAYSVTALMRVLLETAARATRLHARRGTHDSACQHSLA